MTITIEKEITNKEIIAMVAEARFEDSEKIELLKALFPSRSCTDRQKLMGEVTECIYLNM